MSIFKMTRMGDTYYINSDFVSELAISDKYVWVAFQGDPEPRRYGRDDNAEQLIAYFDKLSNERQ